jgi:hypothetical protein
VDRPRSEAWHPAETGVRLRRILIRLSQQAHHALASGLPRLGRSIDPESRGEPTPEPQQELSAPATKASPAPPDCPFVHLETEPKADLALGLAVDEVEPKRLEDHRAGVPAAWVEQVGQNTDRLRAARAEVTPDRDLVLVSWSDDSENLAPVDSMAHDPYPIGPICQVPAIGAAIGTQCLDRWESGSKVR